MQMRQRPKVLAESVFRALIWTSLNCLFGLVQVWVVLLIAYLLSYDLGLADLVARGEVLFFSMALIMGIAIDYYFSTDILRLPRWILGILLVVLPALISVLSIATYVAIYLEVAHIDRDKVMVFQVSILCAVLVYSVCIKFLQFLAMLTKS